MTFSNTKGIGNRINAFKRHLSLIFPHTIIIPQKHPIFRQFLRLAHLDILHQFQQSHFLQLLRITTLIKFTLWLVLA
jgi:hypothetical protein